MNFFSIKWKISISFIVFTMSFLLAYVILASDVFESDKISYVFETQQRQVESLSLNFANEIERAILGARAIVLGYDHTIRRVSPSAQKLFLDNKSIQSIELREQGKVDSFFSLDKTKAILPVLGTFGLTDSKTSMQLRFWKDQLFVLTLVDYDEDQNAVQTRVVFAIEGLLEDALEGQVLAILENQKVVMGSLNESIKKTDIEDLFTQGKKSLPDGTSILEINGDRELVSLSSTSFDGFRIIGMLPESLAMSALKALFRRSIVFVFLSVLGTICFSLLLSLGLTRNIKNLTMAAERLGSGDFSNIPVTNSRDEVGILSRAFQRMILEIQRLLRDTADKARMEAELKTARLVQESLFPEKPDAAFKNLNLSGLYATSSECGGDWWYYYTRGDEAIVVVADATGHGTPAALVTSAARSVFSFMERADLSLPEIATHWNEAVAVCSKQKVFMTALMVRINVITGVGSYINAGHEPPILLSRQGEKFSGEFLVGVQNATLGERTGQAWSVGQFELPAGGRLVCFTDGLTAFVSPEGKSFGEKRLLKTLEKLSLEHSTTRSYVNAIFKFFDDFGGNQTLPDDVTLAVIERKS